LICELFEALCKDSHHLKERWLCFFLSNPIPSLCSSSCLTDRNRTSGIMSNHWNDSGHTCCGLMLNRMFPFFSSPLCVMFAQLCLFFIYRLFFRAWGSSFQTHACCELLLRVDAKFYQTPFCIYWYNHFFFILLVYCICWLLNVKSTYHS
jgi:hypothetical protein